MAYKFFYDESEHSRKINKETVLSNNFAHDFVGVIIGFDSQHEEEILRNYTVFENIYKKSFTVSELKSEIIKPKQIRHGFASLNKLSVAFIKDYFDFVIRNNLLIYYSIYSKIEYIVNQLFSNYHNSILFDMDSLRYAITKMLVMYHPNSVYEAIYRNDGSLIDVLKKFVLEKINDNKGVKHKRFEIDALKQVLFILSNYTNRFIIDWNYDIAFIGFNKYLSEKNIEDYALIIDKEGDGKTACAASDVGLINVQEQDSKDVSGVRIADIFAGLLSKFLKVILSNLMYTSDSDSKNLKYLSKEWFDLDENKLDLYKLFKYVLVEQNSAWYKSFSGNYIDSFLYLVSILNYFSSYNNIGEYNRYTAEEHILRLNSFAIKNLKVHFAKMSSKLPVDIVAKDNKDFYYNQRGAKCYYDYIKQEVLTIPALKSNKEHGMVYNVLSVGVFGGSKQPCVTVQLDGKAQCLLLPKELMCWAINVVGLANTGSNIFPCDVEFGCIDGRYYAEII